MESVTVLTKTKWAIDAAHSQVGFITKHLMFTNIRGRFSEFEASIYTTGEDFLSAEIDFWINPESIDTGIALRDAHLKSPDFFDIDKYREINFTGNTFLKVDKEGNFELYGDLTIRGIKKQIKLYVEFGGISKDPWGTDKALFHIHGKMNRKDWGLTWNKTLETGGLLVSDEVWINCEVQLLKQSL